MKLVEKYLYAIGRQLPRNNKEEVVKELRSTLLDTIEGQYGEEPSEQEISDVLKSFGSPSEVAKEYGKSRYVISPGLTDLYWLILKIVFFAMLGAFTIAYVAQFFTGDNNESNIILSLFGVVGNAVMGSVSAVGSITLIFAVISRYAEGKMKVEVWDPKMLEELPSDKEAVSFIGTSFGIGFSVIFIVLFNLFPEMINLPIESLHQAGFDNVHSIEMERFYTYLIPLNVIWIGTLIHGVLTLVKNAKTKGLRVYNIILSFATVGLFYAMMSDKSLYVGEFNFIGFRGVFAIVFGATIIDILSEIVKFFVHE